MAAIVYSIYQVMTEVLDLRYSCTKEKVADTCVEHSRAVSRAVHRLPY